MNRLISASCLALAGLAIAAAQSTQPSKNAGPVLLVVNQEDRNVSVIDPVAGRQTTTVAESGVTGHEVAVYPPGHVAFVPIYGDAGVGKPGSDGRVIDVIDLKTFKRTGKVDFGHGVRPHCVIYDPVSGMMYVTTELDKTVSIVDPKTLTVVGAIPTSQEQSHMLALSHDGRFGYTANVGPGTVSVLDMKARRPIAVVPVTGDIQRISISGDDSKVFTADQQSPRLAVIDTATKTLKRWVPLTGIGYGTASTKDGRYLLVTESSINKVEVIDLETFKAVKLIDVGEWPVEILVRPDGVVAYVSCIVGNSISEIDLKTLTFVRSIAAGKSADGMAWAQ